MWHSRCILRIGSALDNDEREPSKYYRPIYGFSAEDVGYFRGLVPKPTYTLSKVPFVVADDANGRLLLAYQYAGSVDIDETNSQDDALYFNSAIIIERK